MKVFRLIDFDTVTIEQIIEKLKLFKKTEWYGREIKYIPHASRWLKGKGYFDEVESGKKKVLEKKVCVACDKPASMKIGGDWFCLPCHRKGL